MSAFLSKIEIFLSSNPLLFQSLMEKVKLVSRKLFPNACKTINLPKETLNVYIVRGIKALASVGEIKLSGKL